MNTSVLSLLFVSDFAVLNNVEVLIDSITLIASIESLDYKSTTKQHSHMLLAIVATAVTIASKVGSFVTGASAIGPIVHQLIVGAFNASNASSKVLLLPADAEQSCVTVSKDEQSCVAETLVEVESNEMVQNVSRAMVQYNKPSSISFVMNLSNESVGKSLFDMLIKDLSSFMVIFMSFAAWYRSRIVAMLQSAFYLLVGAEHCTQKKEFNQATRVIQMKIFLLAASAINRWKEIIHSLLGPLLLIGAEAQLHCGLLTAETAFTSVLRLLPMLFAAANGVFHAIQMKICLFVASAMNMLETICSCNASTVLGPLLLIGAEVKVEQRLCGTALISATQHLAVLFAVGKGVLLEYKSSRPHLPGMKQFASMFLVLLIGLRTMSGSWRVHPIISRSSIISSYDTAGLEDLVSSAVFSGLSDASFLPGAVLLNDDHLSTEPTRSGLLDKQSLSTAFASNDDLMALNVGLIDENDQSLCMTDWSGYNNGPMFLPQTDLHDVASTALSLDCYAFDCTHLVRSMDASGTAQSSLIMICTLNLASDRVDVVSFHGFISEYYFAVVVVKQLDVYTVSAIIVDSRNVYSFDPHDLFELSAYSRLSSEADEGTSNLPMFAKLSTPEEAIPYPSEGNDDVAELSFHKALPVQLQGRIDSSSVASHQSWDSTSYKVSVSPQMEVSSALVHQPNIDPFTLVRWRLRSASSLLKAFHTFDTWELHQLVFMVLLIVVCRDADTNTDHPEEVHPSSNSLPTNSQDTLELENEASFDDQQDEAEETLTPVTHKHKLVSQESAALLSDLGRHWNSPPKRRCRRSPRKRRKPTRYQPM